MRKLLLIFVAFVSTFVATNCYGGFVATRKVYHWNGGLGNKWVNTIVMWVMIIIPVYEVVAFVDFVILNTLEFWTGSNPMAMKAGEIETQIVKNNGKEYEITATQNQFEIKEIANGKRLAPVYLTFKPEETAWYFVKAGKSTKISQMSDAANSQVKLFHPDGRSIEVKL